ncbi:DUF1223 domain-containing protein [Acidipila rosea]|uniref:Secreted protein n=1 Tax=Acidipila rosea TaxID=768535 RepID=A0A4R1KYT5_9BACT|nr:DUF1223 domain-containing protein [Acidipila rosea]TCK69750.1 hypothetical protein C7378_3498 [Acidipila rosea]
MQFRSVFAVSISLFSIHPLLAGVQSTGPAVDRAPNVAIVELFTSEGCSSCPPADALLGQIHLKQSPSGQLIVGISEHVTYWNSLGWKDPYSSPVFTERQSAYASRLSPEGSYTPQMVLNGKDQFVGSNGTALDRALREDAKRTHVDLRIVAATLSVDGVDAKFSLSGHTSKPLDVIAVLTDDADRSSVLRGENTGRLLQHVSVARSLTRVATVAGDAEKSIHLPLPDGFQTAVGAGHHIVLFAQEAHQGTIVGAATASL